LENITVVNNIKSKQIPTTNTYSLNILFVCQLQTWEQCDKHKAIPKSIKALSPSLHKEIPHNPRAPGAIEYI